ncbi:hypothetical protein ABZP36_022984 [Zizania latifolia]
MSSAVDAISCSNGIAAPPEEAKERVAAVAVAKKGAAEHGGDVGGARGDALNGKQFSEAPHCRKDDVDEEDEEEVPKAIDLGPIVSIKDQLEKDKVRTTHSPLPLPEFLQQLHPLLDCYYQFSVSSINAPQFVHFTLAFLRVLARVQDDESLRRWKEQLLGSVDLNSVGETLEPDVKIMSLSILSPGRPDIFLPLPVEPNAKGVWFTLKEGSLYKLKFTFSVSDNIVSGLRYTNAVWKTGIKVDSHKEMLGTFSPQPEPYTYVTPEETTPSGMFARGHYSARTKFLDDDRKCYLEINYTFDIRREWPALS